MDDASRTTTLEDLNRTYARLRGYMTIKPWALELPLAMEELESIQGEGIAWSVDRSHPATCTIIRQRRGVSVEFRSYAETGPEAIMKALISYFRHASEAPR